MKLIATVALAALLACPAYAASCVKSLEALVFLEAWGMSQVETRQFPATDDPTVILDIQLWVNAATGEWVLFKEMSGVSCIIIKDKNYSGQRIDQFLPGEPA